MANKQQTADEVFVNLLRASKEDDKIRKFLMAVSELDEFGRNSLINSFVSEMTFKGAPAEFIGAIAALRNPELCKDLKEWLQSNH